MKLIVLFTMMLLAIPGKSQSLLDAVYGGKIKADTGAVLRKSDSLKIKESMAQKNIADSIRKDSITAAIAAAAIAKQNATVSTNDTSTALKTGIASNTTTAPNTGVVVGTSAAAAVTAESITPDVAAAAPKDNNKIWKAFIDSFTTTIKSEVLTSGKIKKGTYSVLINYEIKPDGQVNINNVASDPQSSFLDEQIKLRLTLDTPQLNPVLGTNGQPRTVAKKQMLTLVK